jgi:predicted GNAT superfamily acetyltransferase
VDALTMRPAQDQDFERIIAINQAGQPGVSPLALAELAAIEASASLFEVAEIDRELVGYVIAYADTNVYDGEEFNWFKRHFTHFLYIDQIAIAQSARRAGVGARMYQLLEQRAYARALTTLTCEVNLEPPNPVSLAFHTRQRFIEVGTLATTDGRTVSLRRKELSQSNAQ